MVGFFSQDGAIFFDGLGRLALRFQSLSLLGIVVGRGRDQRFQKAPHLRFGQGAGEFVDHLMVTECFHRWDALDAELPGQIWILVYINFGQHKCAVILDG